MGGDGRDEPILILGSDRIYACPRHFPYVQALLLPFRVLAGAAVLASPLSAGALRLKVDPAASSVTFAARVNIGIDSFTGTVEHWSLDLTMPPAGDLPDHAVFTCDVLAMKTGKDKRDAEMQHWLENDKHPEVRFAMKDIHKTAGGLEADGDLTIHGQTQPITIPLTIERKDAHLNVRGEVTVDYRNYDLKIVRLAGFVTVKPEVKVVFVVQGTLE